MQGQSSRTSLLSVSNKMLTRSVVSACLCVVVCIGVLAQTTLDKKSMKKYKTSDNPHISRYAYILSGSVWRDSPILHVCWENPSNQFTADMETVREAVAETWQKVSKLEFKDWNQCATHNAGIHIRIDDSGPHTTDLGRKLNAVPDGMLLNFSFQNWSQPCQNQHHYCVYAIAVHEFGHAIGFAHEQNRYDAPGECQLKAQGGNGDELLTPYDPHSVMNYCNQQWNNDGHLSPLDKAAVQELYGAR